MKHSNFPTGLFRRVNLTRRMIYAPVDSSVSRGLRKKIRSSLRTSIALCITKCRKLSNCNDDKKIDNFCFWKSLNFTENWFFFSILSICDNKNGVIIRIAKIYVTGTSPVRNDPVYQRRDNYGTFQSYNDYQADSISRTLNLANAI